jgi:hypothetical protein
MEDLDVKIDTMCREKLFTLIQENSVRSKKINIRQTKNNKKNSIEHLDELYASYEKLLRGISKELLNIEKVIRRKFLLTLNEERKIRVLSSINEEMDLIIQEMIKKYQELYTLKGSGDEFNSRIEQTAANHKENLETIMDKLVHTLDKEMETTNSISPDQLQEKYGIDRETLNQMHLVKVLQDIHMMFPKMTDNNIDESVLNGVHDGIIERVKFAKKVENQIPPARDVTGRKAWRMRVAKETVKMKEMIYALHSLAESVQKLEEQRNYDVIKKTWGRIEETFDEHPKEEAELILEKLKPFYNLLDNHNN